MTTSEFNEVPSVNPDDQMFQSHIADMTKYMRFIGLLNIIGGAFTCIGIITAIIGIPVIISGLRLREAADSFRNYASLKNERDLKFAIEKQKQSFYIQFVLAVISLVIVGLYIIFMFFFVLSQV